MAQPAPVPDVFCDEYGYFRSPEAAAAYAMCASGGQGFTTPAIEARRMLTSTDARWQSIGRNWLAANGLPEAGDAEPPDWQNWFSTWIKQNPGPETAMQLARAFPEAPVQTDQNTWGRSPGLSAVPDLPPAPPKKVVVQVQQGSRLESLLSQREEAKAALDEWTKRMATIKDGITAELTEQHPGTGAFDIPAGPGRPAMTLRYTAPNMFDTKRFKTERPDLYPQFLKPSPRWTLGVPQQKNSQ
jgi:hypothetical protein